MPVSACSNLPMRVVAAPVNAPFSWPNSSLSSSSAGSAAQLTFTNGRSFRGRSLVDRARHELLADAALAADEDGDVAVGHLFDDLRDRLHLGTVAPEQERAVLIVAQLPAQLGDFRHEARLLDRALDRGVERDFAEALRIVRLDDVVGGAEPHGFDDGRGLLAARQHDAPADPASPSSARAAFRGRSCPGIITSSRTMSGGSPCLTAASISSPRE